MFHWVLQEKSSLVEVEPHGEVRVEAGIVDVHHEVDGIREGVRQDEEVDRPPQAGGGSGA